MARKPIKTVAWSIYARESLSPIDGDEFFNLTTGETFKFEKGEWKPQASAFNRDAGEIVLDPVPVEAQKKTAKKSSKKKVEKYKERESEIGIDR